MNLILVMASAMLYSLIVPNPVSIDTNGKLIQDLVSADVVMLRDKNETRQFSILPTFQEALPGTNYEGTLVESVSSYVDSRLLNKTPAVAKPVFSLQDHVNKNYTRNPNCWCDVDMTCISPWNAAIANLGGGCLITKRHMISVAHAQISGGVVRFVTQNGAVVDRDILSKSLLSGPSYKPDLCVYLLSEDLPNTISPSKILPDNYSEYIRSNDRIPVLILDQEEKALITDLLSLNETVIFRSPSNETCSLFFENMIGYDSGNPAFIVVNGELVLLCSVTFGGAGGGTFLSRWIPQINQMIVDCDTQAGISTGYQIQTISLSGFTTV